MNESLQETASLYVLDQLDVPTRSDFEARLRREPELTALVHELEAGLARGIQALPPVAPPADLFDRIEASLAQENPLSAPVARIQPAPLPFEPSRLPPPVSHPGRNWAAVARWGLAAMIAVSLGTLAIQSLRRPAPPVFVVVGLDGNRSTFTELPQGSGAKDPDARFIQLASLAENYWRKPVPVPPTADGNRGYALFDPGSQQGFIVIEQIPTLGKDQRYHLWIADAASGGVRDAGTLPLGGVNRGIYSFALEPTVDPQSTRPLLFVTAEDAGAAAPSAQPRGKVVLGQRSF